MERLHGRSPDFVDHPDPVLPEIGDIPICITGLRKGEKLYEELLIGNNAEPTQHPRIMKASEISLPYAQLMPILDRLFEACADFDVPAIQAIIHELPVAYRPTDQVVL
jgi:FlaA1/EpsC-like NDP-sugar epimerase